MPDYTSCYISRKCKIRIIAPKSTLKKEKKREMDHSIRKLWIKNVQLHGAYKPWTTILYVFFFIWEHCDSFTFFALEP